jgi:hypothetical protein
VARKASEPAPEVALQMLTVEVLFIRHDVPQWAQVGLRRRMKWAAGKMLAEVDFLQALAAWRNGPVG